MSDIFQIAGIGLLEGQQRLEAISLNAANAALPGFRRHVVTGRDFNAALTAPDAAAPQRLDLQPGAMMSTGRALDAAIDSDHLYFALTDGTNTWLTRAGSFHLNANGMLAGERDLRVVGTEGEIRLPTSDVTIEVDGRLTHEGVTLATLQLFKPGDSASVMASSGALLAASEIQPADLGAGRVRGGMLEASNTDASREMLDLVQLSRQFESLSRIVQSYDDVLGRAISKLGEV
jgi:flagellar basal body rod protein FlgG